jgi:vacuolar iron transporter family protein
MPIPELPEGATSAREYPLDQIASHIAEERRAISLLGEIRETVFGAQDGLVSTLAVVATVAGATSDNLTVLIAGLASAVAGVFSMAAGEYLGSKSQAEIFATQIEEEREEVDDRPLEAEAEIAYLFMQEGMAQEDAWDVAGVIGRYPDSLLATMVAKELGLVVENEETAGSPFRGALVMGGAFAAGAAVPVLPFVFVTGMTAVVTASVATGLVLFAIGAVKSRWTHRFWLWSGLELL